MGDENETPAVSPEEEKFEKEISVEIGKLEYYLEDIDELIESDDIREIKVTSKRTDEILDRLNELVLKTQELKLEKEHTQRSVRQWRKDIKSQYAPLVKKRGKLVKVIEETEKQAETRKLELQYANEEKLRQEVQQQERQLWEERLQAELVMTERKLEMERAAQSTKAKLPKLKITPFEGTSTDWIRFENMFLTQVDRQPISDEEKFGYLLEMVSPKVRSKISNIKPSSEGYKRAWDRLKNEYGQTKVVINSHMESIINLSPVKGVNYDKVQVFYEQLFKNFDALQTLGESDMLKGFVLTTLNKLPQIKPDLVRSAENWEDWGMEDLLKALQKWLKINKAEDPPRKHDGKRERNWYTGKREQKVHAKPHCLFCEKDHWGEACEVVNTIAKRREFFMTKRLCFNCGRPGHREKECRSRGCFKCKARHHTSLCDRKEAVFTGYIPTTEEKSLPPIIPLEIQGIVFWAYLDSGSGRNFISRDAVERLKLAPTSHESRHIVTVNGVKKQSLPLYQVTLKSLNGREQEKVEITGSSMADFTVVKRPKVKELKARYQHAQNKEFYMTADDEYPIHIILGDSTYCKIRTEQVFKGHPEDPIVEGTRFGWIIHGGEEYGDDKCMFAKETSFDYERLCSLDVLGVEDRGQDDQLQVYEDFKENIVRRVDGRYEVHVPWIPGSKLSGTNEQASRGRLANVERKLSKDPVLKEKYEEIVKEQLDEGIIETAPETPTGERTFYMPHKPVIREDTTTTKVRMVFDASARPHPLANSINDCMYTGPPLQPLLWDIMIRTRMSTHILLADIQKAFLQIGIREQDRDAFRFLFNVNGTEQNFRFTRVPFGAEASPFMLGATLQHHYDQQPAELHETVETLRENTYVDNLMKSGDTAEELEKFKREASDILENAKFPIHKWESDLLELESEDATNPSKILGHPWEKTQDTLEVNVKPLEDEQPVTKRKMLSRLGGIYDPLGLISPTVVEGKRQYREACQSSKEWNSELPKQSTKEWLKWNRQLRTVRVPRSISKGVRRNKAVHLHVFADASNIACSAATIAVVEGDTGVVKGLLTSKSRISKQNTTIPRLELVSGQMAANMVRNLWRALKHWPIVSTIVWMDSLVALYWITNPGKQWKVFVSNRVQKIAKISSEVDITWNYCPTDKNLADLGSRGASVSKLEASEWFSGPAWLVDKEQWPKQPALKCSREVNDEHKPFKETVLYNQEREADEWTGLLSRNEFWRTLRVTAWALRFLHNATVNHRAEHRRTGPLIAEEITSAKKHWIRREQRNIPPDLQTSGFELTMEEGTGILKCKGRIQGYQPTYLEGGMFVEKLVRYAHEQVLHLGIANTMAEIRNEFWVPKLRSKVKKIINTCNTCKVFRAKPYGPTPTAVMPTFRTEGGKPFQTTGVDFAGPLNYKLSKKELSKCYVLIFTCATTRAVHLEMTKTQKAEEFKKKLNAFIVRRTRPKLIISDNAQVFKATASWIKEIRRSEQLQDYLAKQEIRWQFNLSKSPWWGGMYERLLKDVKKTLYKTLGRTHLTFEQLEAVIVDIEKHLNNRPLTYVESGEGEDRVLTPNTIMWGQNSYTLEDDETEEDLEKISKRLNKAKQHAWKRWRDEYVHSLMECHRVNRKTPAVPEIGEIVLIVGDEKNRGEWKKAKVVRYVQGKDGVVRGVVMLYKGHHIERPLQLICSLELKGLVGATEQEPAKINREAAENEPRSRRQAAVRAEKKIQQLAEDEELDF